MVRQFVFILRGILGTEKRNKNEYDERCGAKSYLGDVSDFGVFYL